MRRLIGTLALVVMFASSIAHATWSQEGLRADPIGESVIDIMTSFNEAVARGEGFDVNRRGIPLGVSMEQDADGNFWILQKDGKLRVMHASGDGPNRQWSLSPDYALDISNQTCDAGDLGAVGFELDENFLTNGYIYVSYMHGENSDCSVGERAGQISQFTVVDGYADPWSEKVLFRGPADSLSHANGEIERFGDILFFGYGDAAGFDSADPRACGSQDINNIRGKLYRIYTDGRAVEDNPFYADTTKDSISAKVFAYGLRNPYSFIPLSRDKVIIGAVGYARVEAVYHSEPGNNHGWPLYEGSEFKLTDYANLPDCPLNLSDGKLVLPAYEYPHRITDTPEGRIHAGAIILGAFATNDEYQNAGLQGALIGGDYRFDEHFALQFSSDYESATAETILPEGAGYPVHYITGDDGYVYYLAIGAGRADGVTLTEVRRIRASAQQQVPVTAYAYIDPLEYGKYVFTCEISDPRRRDDLVCAWDFGDGNYMSGKTVEHTYASAGSRTAGLTIRDSSGNSLYDAKRSIVVPDPLQDISADPYVEATAVPESAAISEVFDVGVTLGNQGKNSAFIVRFEFGRRNGNVVTVDHDLDREFFIEGLERENFRSVNTPPLTIREPGTFDVNVVFFHSNSTRERLSRIGWQKIATLNVRDRSGNEVVSDEVDDLSDSIESVDKPKSEIWAYNEETGESYWVDGPNMSVYTLGGDGKMYWCPDSLGYPASEDNTSVPEEEAVEMPSNIQRDKSKAEILYSSAGDTQRVTFDCSKSFVHVDDAVRCKWDFGDGTSQVNGYSNLVTHQYPYSDAFSVTLTLLTQSGDVLAHVKETVDTNDEKPPEIEIPESDNNNPDPERFCFPADPRNNKGWNGVSQCHINDDPFICGISDAWDYTIGKTRGIDHALAVNGVCPRLD